MKRILTILTVFAICGFAAPAAAQPSPFAAPLASRGFEEIAKRGNVQVFQNEDSKIIHFAAIGTFDAPPEKVREILLDYSSQVGKIGRLSEAKVISKSARGALVYQRLNLPIVSDRDYVLDVNWGERDGQLWIVHRAITGRGPAAKRGVVRVTEHVGRWRLRPIRGGTATEACFETRINMAGSIPMWMVRNGTARELPRVYSEFSSLLQEVR